MSKNSIQAFLVPFGSFVNNESRGQDYVAFLDNNDVPETIRKASGVLQISTPAWSQEAITQVAHASGATNPDIWLYDQDGLMKPIIVANLIKDYPDAADFIQRAMGLKIDIKGGDPSLIEAMEANVVRWQSAPPHLTNLRKRVFSRIQRAAYVEGFGFFNTKSEIAEAATMLNILNAENVFYFLLGNLDLSTGWAGWDNPRLPVVSQFLGGSEIVQAFRSRNGLIAELPDLARFRPDRVYLTLLEGRSGEKVTLLLEEMFTYDSYYTVIEVEHEVWQMLLESDLEEVR